MKFIGINPLKLEGSKFETSYGYSKFVKMKIGEKSYSPIITATINPWGIKNYEDKVKKNVYGKIEDSKNSLDFSINCSDVEVNGFIAGYPSIRVGETIWGPFNGFKLGRIKDYQKIKINTKFDFSIKKGFANLAYDIWLTKKKDDSLQKGDIEIMVWLDRNFDLPYEQIAETKGYVIKYVMKKPGSPGVINTHWFTFLSKNKNKESDFDLIEVIRECRKKVKNIDYYYIRSIELGIEFSKDTKANAKLYNLNLDFKLK